MNEMISGAIVASAGWVWFYVAKLLESHDAAISRDMWHQMYAEATKGHDATIRALDKAQHDLARCRARIDKVVAAMRDR